MVFFAGLIPFKESYKITKEFLMIEEIDKNNDVSYNLEIDNL